eukprot:12974774-Alexandrium_andersonii.AAC.1
MLVVAWKADSIRLAMIAAHAPHEAVGSQEKTPFWKRLHASIDRLHRRGFQVLLAIDANARVGS